MMGSTTDNLATLELIGNQQDLNKVTMMVGVPKDHPNLVQRNTLLCLTLLKNTFPKWEDRNEWFTTTLQKLAGSPSKSPSETNKVGNASVQLVAHRNMGMVLLVIEKN